MRCAVRQIDGVDDGEIQQVLRPAALIGGRVVEQRLYEGLALAKKDAGRRGLVANVSVVM